MCLICFPFRNSANSVKVNCGPLSDTNCSGNLCYANIALRTSVVFSEVIVVITTASGHFK